MYHISKNINTASSSTGDSTGIDFGSIIFLNLHQWFATFFTKFWNWYVCRLHYHEALPSGQAVTRVKVYNSHYRKVSTMQIAGSALTGWSAMSKNMQKLTGTGQKHRCAKLFGIRTVKYLTWNLHSNYIISKLNCRISLLEKWNLDCGKLLHNSLLIIEYYYTVWGNCSVGHIFTITGTLRQNDIRCQFSG